MSKQSPNSTSSYGTSKQSQSTQIYVDEDENESQIAEDDRRKSSSSVLKTKLNYFDAYALLVSLQIGSGIFASPAAVNSHVAAPGYALILWLVAGLLAWCGETSLAELSVTLPVNGGMQEYIRYIYGDGLAFVVAWIWVMGAKPCSMAIQGITFSQYWISVIFHADIASNGWQSKLLAVLCIYTIHFFNTINMNTTATMTRVFTITKLTALGLLPLMTILSLFHVHRGQSPVNTDWYKRNWFATTNPDWQPGFFNAAKQATIGIYTGLWAYSGWDGASNVTGDIEKPSRNVPLAIHTAQPTVIVGFVLANVCYYLVIPWDRIDTSPTIAVTLGETVCGWLGGLVFAILVSFACLGSININVFTGSRLIVSASRANWLPQTLGEYTSMFGKGEEQETETETLLADGVSQSEVKPGQTPVKAIIFSAMITTLYLFFGNFVSLATFVELCEYTFFSITAIGLVILRFREPDLPRPYRAFILLPIIFACGGLTLSVVGSTQAPVQATLIAIIVAASMVRKYTSAIFSRRQARHLSQE